LQARLIYLNANKEVKHELHPDTFRALKEILAEKSIDGSKFIVKMSRFNQVTMWFGPFFVMHEQVWTILEEIHIVWSKDWFHGDISKEEAEKRLMHRVSGTFLIRLSTTTPDYPFTISMVGNQHRRILHKPGTLEYSLKGSTHLYNSLVALVENSLDMNLVDLRFPCPKTVVNAGWGYSS
jgi:hypothetical protein